MSLEKSYRYEILLQAIEVFTQRYDKSALFEFAFDFANQLLTLGQSALFIREDDRLTLIHTRNYDIQDYHIPVTEKLNRLPLYHGRPISSHQLNTYFSEEFIRDFSAAHVIPLINDTHLVGLIVTDGKSAGEFSKDDEISSTIMMSLVNSSLENNQRFLDFQSINQELDRKVFSLFVLNQSIKALLSELNVRKLYEMATDVFSEISGSRVTSFGIYDPLTHRIKLKGYRNVHSFHRLYAELKMKEIQSCPNRIVISMKEDSDLLDQLFEDTSALLELEAEYIILIQKERLIGLVTLSDSRQNTHYDSGTIELIETLASSTYIALNNAQLFEKQEKQKREAESKLNVLQMYNRLIRTINSCRTREELLKLSISTLELGFGVSKAFFAFDNGKAYEVAECTGADLAGETFVFEDHVGQNIQDEIYYDYFANRLNTCFADESFCEKLGESTGIVIAPIQMNPEYNYNGQVHRPYGYLIVTQTAENLKEEEILLIDTITRNITPLIYHMDQKETFIFSES
ncbi:GAF domain-containing protein [Metabacillus sp. FJAT-52054]|uniref:GAF domain-containing protein n=1 Tax=Metabacillus sediminis TaxID=3117746 RepID=A0ABZ2NJD9_9BACI